MKKCRIIVAAALLFALCLGLCACGISKEEVVGTWTSTTQRDEETLFCAIAFTEDGKYAKVIYTNDQLSAMERGTYKLSGTTVALYKEGANTKTDTYSYEDGKLLNGGHIFTKDEE